MHIPNRLFFIGSVLSAIPVGGGKFKNKPTVMPCLVRHITAEETAAVIEAARRRLPAMRTVETMRALVTMIDHTSLSVTDSDESVRDFTRSMLEACRPAGVMPASVCVSPIFVESVGVELGDEPVAICSVAGGFPTGQTFPEVKMLECAMAMENGADELDIVADLGALGEGRYDEASSEIRLIKEEAGDDVVLKTIIETGSQEDLDDIYTAAIVALEGGTDFVKSSTGKNCGGVTPEAAAALCMAVADYNAHCGTRAGVKVAGGVSSADDALLYAAIAETVFGEKVTPDMFRIGSSSLLGAVLKEIGVNPEI